MFLIIIYHYSLYGNWKDKELFPFNFFLPFGQIGVFLFVMISGWFLSVEAFNLNKLVKRILRLWIQVIFYSWVLLIIDMMFHYSGGLNLKKILYGIFPVFFNEYWFVTSFIVLMIMTPLLNKMIVRLRPTVLLTYIIFFLICSSILPILNDQFSPFGSSSNVCTFITCYLFVGYLHKYGLRLKNSILISVFFLCVACEYIPLLLLNDPIFTSGIFPLIAAAGIFTVVTRLKSFHVAAINFLASSIFASYLITENDLVRIPLWHKWLDVAQFSNHVIIAGIIITTFLLIITILIDKIYKIIYHLIFSKFVKSINIGTQFE